VDAYPYFEARFGLSVAGSVALGDAVAPSPARVAALRRMIAERNIACIFIEPQFNMGLVDAIMEDAQKEGTRLHTAVLDPQGYGGTLGPGLYEEVMLALARAIAGCL